MKVFAKLKMKFSVWILLLLINWQENDGVKHLVVRQNLFDRTIDKETVRGFSTLITKKGLKKNWVDKETELAGEFKKNVMFKDYKYTLQWVRHRLLFLNVQVDQ